MRVIFLLVACSTSFSKALIALPFVQKRDAPFQSVRTRLDKDYSKPKPGQPDKYFHEAWFNSHYDGRFADREVAYDGRRNRLRALIQTYLATMSDIGIETFLMHGTLLGWYWNRKILPWDDDVDVMLTERSMYHLANYYNMTVHSFRFSESGIRCEYLLEINPHSINDTLDAYNMIDARWIDTDTGLYIDLTTLRVNQKARALGINGAMIVKDKHHYKYDDIFPLRESTFEGFPVRVPFAYAQVLVEEYGISALTNALFHNHRYDAEKKDWLPIGCQDYKTCNTYRNRLPNGPYPASHRHIESNDGRVPKLPVNADRKPTPPQPPEGQNLEGG